MRRFLLLTISGLLCLFHMGCDSIFSKSDKSDKNKNLLLMAMMNNVNITGTWQWTRLRGGSGVDTSYGICISGDNIYISGQTSASFDNQTYGGGAYDAFLMKFN